MVPFVLPNLLHIADSCTDQEYVRLVLPELKPVFKIQEPVQVRRKVRPLVAKCNVRLHGRAQYSFSSKDSKAVMTWSHY